MLVFASSFIFTGVKIPIAYVCAYVSACASSRTTPSQLTSEICNFLELFSTPMALQTRSGEIFNDSVQFQTEKPNSSRRPSRTSDCADIAKVTLLICREKQRNVQRFLSHAYSHSFIWWRSRFRRHRGLLKGARSRLERFEMLSLNIFDFVVCNPCQSSPSLTILVPSWIIVISFGIFWSF